MATKVKFTKMQGAGNDYIYVDTFRYPIADPAECARRWSAPHTGIGSDGLVLIGPSETADFRMRIFNADGSEAMMCGNASRCIGKYVYEHGLTEKTELTLETLSGIKTLRLHLNDNHDVESVTVDMGTPARAKADLGNQVRLELEDAPIAAGHETFRATTISMGNPHLVIFIDDITCLDLPSVGPLLERHPWFPDRINVEFAQLLDDNHIRMRVWERGSGITQACGTGACATAVAAILTRHTPRDLHILMDGGTLRIQWDETDGHVYMTGPAVTVYEGEILTD